MHLLLQKRLWDTYRLKGKVYQAGTLSGNPVAMAAGLVSLRKLKANPVVYADLNEKAKD